MQWQLAMVPGLHSEKGPLSQSLSNNTCACMSKIWRRGRLSTNGKFVVEWFEWKFGPMKVTCYKWERQLFIWGEHTWILRKYHNWIVAFFSWGLYLSIGHNYKEFCWVVLQFQKNIHNHFTIDFTLLLQILIFPRNTDGNTASYPFLKVILSMFMALQKSHAPIDSSCSSSTSFPRAYGPVLLLQGWFSWSSC